jgi:myo-inositol-1(or 4)-monophosphatase
MSLEKETDFFHFIAPEVRKLVLSYGDKASIAKQKDIVGDFATEIDIAVEELIVKVLQERFPGDAILAEESFSTTMISDDRIWIIDPICGTTNIGRGMKTFSTNIALAHNRQLMAACVVDFTQEDYIWSIGNGELSINEKLFCPTLQQTGGIVIDVDFGSLGGIDNADKKNLIGTVLNLSLLPGYLLQSINSSLAFAYVAVGKIDGFINITNHLWDISAAAFLIQQSGGTITDLRGNDWTVTSRGAIAATNARLHRELLAAYARS